MKDLVRKLVPRTLRNWVRHPGRSIAYVRDRLAYRSGASRQISPHDGWDLRCHPAAAHHFGIFREDPVQRAELESFIARCQPGMQLLDIGAHFGFFALAALRYGGPDARALCVEASPRATTILRANLRLEGAESRTQVLNCAAGGQDGELPMLATGPLGGDYFVVPTEARADTTTIPQKRIDSILTETGFQPTHVKIDIESFEYEVVEAAREVLARLRPVLFLELHGNLLAKRDKDPRQVLAFVREAGYTRLLLDDQEVSEEALARQDFNARLICI